MYNEWYSKDHIIAFRILDGKQSRTAKQKGKCPDYFSNVVSLVDCRDKRRGLRSLSSFFRLLSASVAHQVRGAHLYVHRPVCVQVTAEGLSLRAVTDPGLFRKRPKTHFLVWLSVFADDTDDCNAPMTYSCNRRTTNPRMIMMMMTMMMMTTMGLMI